MSTLNSAGSLRLAGTLQTLRDHGVEVQDPFAERVNFLDCDQAPATFVRADARSFDMKTGESLKPHVLMRTLHLNPTQLEKAASIVSGDPAGLTADERAGVKAFEDLVKRGGRIELCRTTLRPKSFCQVRDVGETVSVPQDESGKALVLLLLDHLQRHHTSDGTYRMDIRCPKITVDGHSRTITTLPDFIEAAHSL